MTDFVGSRATSVLISTILNMRGRASKPAAPWGERSQDNLIWSTYIFKLLAGPTPTLVSRHKATTGRGMTRFQGTE